MAKQTPAPPVKPNKSLPAGSKDLTAKKMIERLKMHQSNVELKKIQGYFKSGEGQYGEGDTFMGVRMGQIFALAQEFIEMPLSEVEKLMESPIHEIRASALSIMDKKGRNKKTTEEERKALFDLYLRRHDRINNWDLVDLAAIHVVGAYLNDKPKKILYNLAKSKEVWERRTAIVSTAYFLKEGNVEETFRVAEILVNDPHDMVQKPVGGWIRHAGKQNPKRLLEFLETHAVAMPRTALRYAIEHLSQKQKHYYMGLKK